MQNYNIQNLYAAPEFDIMKCNYEWRVDNIIILNANQSINSPVFRTSDNSEWKIEFYYSSADHYSNSSHLKLCLLSDNHHASNELKIKVTFSIMNYNKVSIFESNATYSINSKGTFYNRITNYQKLINSINSSETGHLIISCSFIVYSKNFRVITQCNENISQKVYAEQQLLNDFKTLLETQTCSDVTLIANHKEFYAHKAILAARSSVFRAMFQNNMIEKKENKVMIKSVKSEVLSEMLRFIYTGQVENIEKIEKELLEAADRYDIPSLQIMCSRAICESLRVKKAADMLIFADLHNAAALKANILMFIAKNAKEVMNTKGFNTIMNSHPDLRLEIFRALT